MCGDLALETNRREVEEFLDLEAKSFFATFQELYEIKQFLRLSLLNLFQVTWKQSRF